MQLAGGPHLRHPPGTAVAGPGPARQAPKDSAPVGPFPSGCRVLVRVPATSANLGPGFDCFGLALGRYDEVMAEACADGLHVSITGVGEGDLPRDNSHLVVRAATAAFAAVGAPLPGLRLTCHNRIPHGSGQGSSAAAIVAGVLLARALVPKEAAHLDDEAVLALATQLEGHPDNVAPALYGGFTLAWIRPDGRPAVVRRDVHPDITAVVFTAERACATAAARAMLPAGVPHSDAVANSAAAALMVHAMTIDPSMLMDATRDWLHQRYRAPAMPDSARLLQDLRAAGIPAVLSGAGPSVLALTAGAFDPDRWAGRGFTAGLVAIDRSGAVVQAAVEPAPAH